MKKKGQQQQKVTKVVVKEVLTPDDTLVVKSCFDCFDPKNTGKINPRELKETMEQLGFAKMNQWIIKIMLME